jgi:hypothetical protein
VEEVTKMEKQWEELSADAKQEAMFNSWLSPQGIEFTSPEAEKSYKERVTRLKDAIQLKKVPDRVPIFTIVNFFPAYYVGLTPKDMMYDYEKLTTAVKKYVLDFEPDANPGGFFAGSARIFEILDVKLYAWPGHGVAPEHSYQCLEGEYMMADEYDDLIQDPSHFWSSIYLPRICGALEPFKMLQSPTTVIQGAFGGYLMPFGLPQVQATYKTLFEAGAETWKWMGVVGAIDKDMAAAGFPAFLGGLANGPFDVIGDTLRGTKGIMLDMYRQPDKLLEAMEVVTPLMVKMGVSMARMNGKPMVFVTLHKGADGFLSDEQFKTFYWPTLRKLLMGLIDEGCVPFLFVEGSYNSRLEIIRDIPKGKTVWSFDMTDMAKAKEILGDVACIGGNMPTALLSVGTPQEVKDYAKKLIDTAGKGVGYIMANGAAIDKVKPENLKAMIDFTKEYGVYR